jgi:hypothetical protein
MIYTLQKDKILFFCLIHFFKHRKNNKAIELFRMEFRIRAEPFQKEPESGNAIQTYPVF